jgi:hypothetical protein
MKSTAPIRMGKRISILFGILLGCAGLRLAAAAGEGWKVTLFYVLWVADRGGKGKWKKEATYRALLTGRGPC